MSDTLKNITRDLSGELDALRFGGSVRYVYNPLDYASDAYHRYLDKYGKGRKEALFIGMNPGHWGMAQTGVPFGDVGMVRSWLDLEGSVGRPQRTHPKRPVLGYACHRGEGSGRRLWSWARKRFETPGKFFERCFVVNYCPLIFFDRDGHNRTPDKLSCLDRERLFRVCDRALERTVEVLRPHYVFGIGRFAAGRAEAVLHGKDPVIACLLHPSPANPTANQKWEAVIEKTLADVGFRPK